MANGRAPQVREHDEVVRALLISLSGNSRAMVVYPHDSDDEWNAAAPDLILTSSATGRILWLIAIETRSSMWRQCSQRWHELAVRAPLTVVVPMCMSNETERLLWRTDARIVEYERRADDEVVFKPAL